MASRQSVIQIAKDLNYEVVEKDIQYEELALADEAFFTGTAVEITPIRKIDEKIIGSGERGPISNKLQEAFTQIISGNNASYSNWLTYTTD